MTEPKHINRDYLIEHLDGFLNVASYDDYGPNGLQVEGKPEIRRIAFAVSATVDSIEEAVAADADALIVHHGIVWKFHGARTLTGPHLRRVRPLIKNDINLLGYHLPLDGHPGIGNARALADRIGMDDLDGFSLRNGVPCGIQGRLREPTTAKALSEILEGILEHPVILASHAPEAAVRSLGIITGGANNDWGEAKAAGLDAYLTGEISEYNWHDAREAEIHMFAGGHHATEKFGIQALMGYIQERFSIECFFVDSENPA